MGDEFLFEARHTFPDSIAETVQQTPLSHYHIQNSEMFDIAHYRLASFIPVRFHPISKGGSSSAWLPHQVQEKPQTEISFPRSRNFETIHYR